ncbi:hypothetical protein CMI37_18765 [Candidatus Pacearchaeota archaeon]|nr:hypothetical protein [Candidatus Pacearchaeota archaeon]
MPNEEFDESKAHTGEQRDEGGGQDDQFSTDSWLAWSHPVDRDTNTKHLQISTDPEWGANRAQLVEYSLYSLEPSGSAASINSLIDRSWSHFTTPEIQYEPPPLKPPTMFLAAGDINEFDIHAQYLERGPTNWRLDSRPNTIFCVYYIKDGVAHPIPNYKTLEVLLVQEGVTYDDIQEATDEDYNRYDIQILGGIRNTDNVEVNESAKTEFNRRKLVTLDHIWTYQTRLRSGYQQKAPFKRDPGDYWSPSSQDSFWDNDENKYLPNPYLGTVYETQTWKEKLREKFEGQLMCKNDGGHLKMMQYGQFWKVATDSPNLIRYYNELNGYDVEINWWGTMTDQNKRDFTDYLVESGICMNLSDSSGWAPVWHDFNHPGSYENQDGTWSNNDPLRSRDYRLWWDRTFEGDMFNQDIWNPYEPAGSVKYYGNYVESSAPPPPASTGSAATGSLINTDTLISQLDCFLVDGDALKDTLGSMTFVSGLHAEAASEVKNDMQKIWVTDSDTGENAWRLKLGPFGGPQGTNDYTEGTEIDSDRSFWKLIAMQADQNLIDVVQDGYNDFAFYEGEDKGFGPTSVDIISSSIAVMNQGSHGSVALHIPSYLFLDQANIQIDPVFQVNEFYYKTYGDTVYDAATQNLNLNNALLYSDQYWTAGLSKYPKEVPLWGDDIALLNTIPNTLSEDGTYNDTPFDRDVRESLDIFHNTSQDVINLLADIDVWLTAVTALKSEITSRIATQTAVSQINQSDINRWTNGPNNQSSHTYIDFLQETWDLEIIPQSDAIQNISSNPASNELVQTSVDFIKNQIGRTYIERMWLMIQYIRLRLWTYSGDTDPWETSIINWPNSAKTIVEKYWPQSEGSSWVIFHPENLSLGGSTSTNPIAIPPILITTLTFPNADNNPPVIARVYQYTSIMSGYTIGQYKMEICSDTNADNYTSLGNTSNRPTLKQYMIWNRTNMDGGTVDAPDTEFVNAVPPIYGYGGGNTTGGSTGNPPASGTTGGGTGTGGGGSTGGFCFVGETLITLPSGLYKRIDQIEIGDIVKSENGVSTVEKINIHPGEHEVYALNNSKYFVTKEHPFKTEKGWKAINPHETWEYHGVESNILDVGDVLIKDGKTEVLNIISKCDTTVDTVYSLILDNERVYYVYDYLVHNAEELGKGDVEPGVDPNP